LERRPKKDQVATSTALIHKRSKSEIFDYDGTKPPKPPPPSPYVHLNKKFLDTELPPKTKFNTTPRILGSDKHTVRQSLSAIGPSESERTSPHVQPNEKPLVKRDTAPSPKPRSLTAKV